MGNYLFVQFLHHVGIDCLIQNIQFLFVLKVMNNFYEIQYFFAENLSFDQGKIYLLYLFYLFH
jgi:hypothetical protein